MCFSLWDGSDFFQTDIGWKLRIGNGVQMTESEAMAGKTAQPLHAPLVRAERRADWALDVPNHITGEGCSKIPKSVDSGNSSLPTGVDSEMGILGELPTAVLSFLNKGWMGGWGEAGKLYRPPDWLQSWFYLNIWELNEGEALYPHFPTMLVSFCHGERMILSLVTVPMITYL